MQEECSGDDLNRRIAYPVADNRLLDYSSGKGVILKFFLVDMMGDIFLFHYLYYKSF
jgi:hypothetical protein